MTSDVEKRAADRLTVPEPEHTPALAAAGVSKTFGGVVALDDVSIWALDGEVTALIGENGAGKSTLVKCLSGVHPPDTGEILVRGEKVEFGTPLDARAAGVETVFQDLALVSSLDVTTNMFLGREIRRPWWQGRILDNKAMRKRAKTVLAEFGITNVDPRAEVGNLSGGQRQGVSIARATGWGASAVIMDEPTAALGVRESQRVIDTIHRLRAANLAVVLVSHNIPQVLEIADRIWILRAGRLVAHGRAGEMNHADVVSNITGMRMTV